MNSARDPLYSAIPVQCVDVQSDSGSHEQCMGPTGKSMFMCFK